MVVNYANADMVGHTGVLAAAIAAVEAVDTCLGRVVEPTVRLGGVCLVTADHGNSDNMLEPDGSPNTAHSTNPVPFVATVPAVDRAPGRRSGRPGAHGAASAGHRAAGGDDRPRPPGRGAVGARRLAARLEEASLNRYTGAVPGRRCIYVYGILC